MSCQPPNTPTIQPPPKPCRTSSRTSSKPPPEISTSHHPYHLQKSLRHRRQQRLHCQQHNQEVLAATSALEGSVLVQQTQRCRLLLLLQLLLLLMLTQRGQQLWRARKCRCCSPYANAVPQLCYSACGSQARTSIACSGRAVREARRRAAPFSCGLMAPFRAARSTSTHRPRCAGCSRSGQTMAAISTAAVHPSANFLSG